MSLRIIIDSGSDILLDEADKLGVIHLPLKVVFDGAEYLDSVNLSHKEFYEKLVESDVLPTTCQITPSDYADALEKCGTDDVLIITLSGKLSGTFQSACIASEEYDGNIAVVDSESVALGERLIVLRAVELRDSGKSLEEIYETLNEEKKRLRVLALLDTLEYLKKGGRISKTVALAGAMLSIKPVVTIENGEVTMLGKARGSRRGNNLLRELVLKGNGIDFSKPYCLAYSGLSDALLKKYIEDSADLWNHATDDLPIVTVGCTIGTHVGPGAIAVAFFEK